MSRLVAFAAIQGAYNIVSKVEGEYKKALATYNADTKVGFPNTAYYLPVIYSLLGTKVETLEDMKKPLEFSRGLLPPHVKGSHHLPYLGPLLDEGMAALFAFEIQEAIRYLNDALLISPDHFPSNHLLGVAYLKKGNLAQARAAFEKCVELDPEYITLDGGDFAGRSFAISFHE